MKITDKGLYLEWYAGPTGKKSPPEKADQKSTAGWLRKWHPEKLFFHPVNESGSGGSQQRGAELNEMGRLTGISDWVILESFGGHPYALIELKRENKADASAVSQEQKDVFEKAKARGAFCAVCYGREAFKACVSYYFTL